MTEGENAEGECTVSLRRVLKYVMRQTGKTRQVKALRRIKFVAYHSGLGKKLKERIHLNLDEESLYKIKLFILC